jgi:hypothetical protein
MKQRKLVIGLLVMLAVAVSGFTFAFWASSVSVTDDTESTTINIGEGQAVTTTVVANPDVTNGKALVPSGRVVDSNTESDSIVITFEVAWTETGTAVDGIAGTLSYTLGDIEVADDSNGTNAVVNPNDLVNVDVVLTDGAAIGVNDGNTYTVTVTITLDEPADQNEYNSVAGQVILFDLTFEITVD